MASKKTHGKETQGIPRRRMLHLRQSSRNTEARVRSKTHSRLKGWQLPTSKAQRPGGQDSNPADISADYGGRLYGSFG
jgi:hypothetical protein